MHLPHRVAAAAIVCLASAVGCTGQGRPAATVDPSPSARATQTTAGQTQRDVLRDYIETNPTWIHQALSGGSYGGRFFCGLNVLGEAQSPTRVFLWVSCQEFYDNNGAVSLGSASSLPAALRIDGAGSKTKVIGFAVPRSGSLYGPDVRHLFPQRLVAGIFAGSHAVDQTDAQLRARAAEALQAGVLPRPSSTG